MPNWFDALFDHLGPGFITGAADDDPSGIATYSQVGARFGLGQVWLAAWCVPFMVAVQEMVGRIGLMTGVGLSTSLRKHYPRPLLWAFVLLIFVANTVNLGTDLGAMADTARLLVPGIPFAVALIGFTLLVLVLEVFITYQSYASILKWLAVALLGYVVTALLVTGNWPRVIMAAFVPHLEWSSAFMLSVVAVLGTTISPYLFVWQADEEVEEEIAKGRTTVRARRGVSDRDLGLMRRDTLLGMSASQGITFCIIATAAGTFATHGITTIASSAQAAQALAPLAGPFASLLFAIGIIGTGLLAVPVLSASASYALAEALGWKNGLYKKLHQAHGFYGAITLATLVGLGINFVGINPIYALFLTSVVNGVLTAPLLFIILLMANNKKIMGKRVNGLWSNALGWATCLVMAVASVMPFVLK